MSTDIRKWFGGGGGAASSHKDDQQQGKSKRSRSPATTTASSKVNKRRRRQIIESDSEPEDVQPAGECEILVVDSDGDGDTKHIGGSVKLKCTDSPHSKTSHRDKKEMKTLTTASDFFGEAHPHRSNKGIAAVTRHSKGSASQDSKPTSETVRRSPRKGKEQSQEQPNSHHRDEEKEVHQPGPTGVKSLSGKLSAKLHAASSGGETHKEETRNSPQKGEGIKHSKPSPDKQTSNKQPSPDKSKQTSNKQPSVDKSKQTPEKQPSLDKSKQTFDKQPTLNKSEKTTTVNGVDLVSTSADSEQSSKNVSHAKTEDVASGSSNRSSGNYRAYLHREGPRALGSKEIPEGNENSFEGLTFVITGVLESLDRDETKSLVERYGGKVTGSISKKTNYVIVGRDAGARKLEMAAKHNTKQLDEDGFLDLIRTTPGKKSKYEVQETAAASKGKGGAASSFYGSKASSKHTFEPAQPAPAVASGSGDGLMWVDRYKPTSLKQIIGQQGDKSCANKLRKWLQDWQRHYNSGAKKKFYAAPGFGGSGDGSNLKAALLSGPPGVGKTTTAHLVCQDVGFTFVELNASDTRSKKSLETEVKEAVTSHSLSNMLGGSSSSLKREQHCLIMDEVDGMAGNEDRGGMQELIQLIKNSKVPIICMCNDRNHPKIRSLSNYCLDLRFYRPRVEQIKGMVMGIMYKEGIKIPPPAVHEVIVAANQDIRQVLHNLSMWSVGDKSLSYDQAKQSAHDAKKDMKVGPFDVTRLVLCGSDERDRMSVDDKLSLFFHDYSIAPLFIQENYPNVTPYSARGDIKQTLSLLSNTADSLATGDIIEKTLRRENNWSLLPSQAIFSSLIPGELMKGSMSGMITFPSWLGKNSKHGKLQRLVQELFMHLHLRISGDVRAVNLDYLPHLYSRVMTPLITRGQEGIQDTLRMLHEYDLVREDMEAMAELLTYTTSSGAQAQQDAYAKLDSKIKAAFTRAYNKDSHLNPYSTSSNTAKKRKVGGGDGDAELLDLDDAENIYDVNEEDEGVESDAMIKAKKKKPTTGSSSAAVAGPSGSSKGRGSGGGGGRGKGKGATGRKKT